MGRPRKKKEESVVDHVELFQDAEGDWRWRAVARNGEAVANSGEGYRSKQFALRMARGNYPGIAVRAG